MLACPSCGGLTPRPLRRCLHCRGRRLFAFLLGPAGAVLLAACYGAPGRYGNAGRYPTTPTDQDGDGATSDVDCDDHDPTRYPGAADPDGDGIDQNCDGVDGWRELGSKVAVPPPDGGVK